MRASSPASTGPAGAHFEGQVGAHYLLTMLIGAEPRGLPGTTINKVAFQQAGVGYPLDDIIVHAHDREGCSAILQIQVKRNATFAPSDEVFGKVVSQVAEAARSHDFTSTRNELAIAISRRSSNIDGPYQDVLTWARWDSAETFKRRISQPGSANDAMRTFVSTFRNNLSKAGAEHDDETVRHLLSRFQILPFDFTAPDSAIAVWDKERAAGALHPDDVGHAGDFRRRLVELAIDTATSGGHLTQETLNEHLRNGAFRLAGERRYSTARSALVEASQHALAEIDDRIGGVTLSRGDQRALVRVALEQGRCVEIRGDGGVGKSALLKHFAEQLATEAPIIVLRPGRTTPGGWTAMKSVLEFDGTARELLVDLASSGGATLFLDGLDFFTDVERRTVADLVREAAGVPGFVVVATARREFDSEDQPNWLPADALDSLGRGAPVVIGELSATEVDELRRAAPELAALLGEGHPARAVARNLFRLARLTKSSAGEQMLRTEIDMAEQWWRTADGERDSGHRERDRLLHALAEQALARTEPLDTSDHPPAAVDALVQSQTLSDLGGDRMAFRHDVFRDWAVANLLYGQTESRKGLPLQGPAPAALVRGVELAARMALERGCDDSDWHKLLDEVSCRGAHGSWRRAVLLALVRSEIGIDLLPRVSEILLAANASLLRELIRTVMAVDVRPAREFAIPGADAAIIPPYMNVPGGPSWWRLISWLLDVSASLPPAAILDVVNLYAGWSFLGDDQLTPRIVEWLHRWLREIETAEYPDDLRELRHASAGELGVDHVRSLETKLRDAFLAFCYHNPPLAAEYIRSMMHHTMTSGVDSVITSPGSLVLAAPEELADLTIAKLLPEPVREQSERSNPFRLRYLFLQPHPDLGPFLGLLTHAQDVGMNLIRRIVDHAVSCSGAGKSHGSKAINIRLADDDREFRWTQSYTWARAWGRGHPCVTTALLALEQWGHRRIADGDSLDDVVADVLGPSGSPAAYLLVVVDIVLKHWPVSREAAVPLVACPELLCLDLDRALNERFGANLTNSAARSAHHSSLFDLLATYAISGPSDGQREHLVSRLGTATERLGPYSERSHRGHPDFMAAHALNLLNPDNWKSVNHVDGTPEMEYVAPDVEARHLARLRDDSRGRLADDQLRVAIKVAVDDRTMSSPKLAADAAEWAQGSAEFTEDRWLLVAAALLTIRDGTDNLRATKEAWARTVFADAVQIQEDHVHGVPSGLRFNAVAIAFAGAVHLLTRRPHEQTFRKFSSWLREMTVPPYPDFAQLLVLLKQSMSVSRERSSEPHSRPAFAYAPNKCRCPLISTRRLLTHSGTESNPPLTPSCHG